MKISFLIVIFFSFIAGFSLLHPGLPPTHDGEYHIVRFYEFDKVLRDGNWYPRWAADLNNGFGVPLFNFVYPLPNYVASLIHAFNISFIEVFKFSMIIATIIGSIFFYLWTRIFWGNTGGVVSSVFYTFSPYRFLDIYIRGSVGEVWALAFGPAFLWAFTKLLKEKKIIFFPISSLFLALVIFSHNIVGFMFFMFFLCYGLFFIFQSKEKKDLLIKFISTLLLGLGLSAVFWLPALLEQEYVKGLKIYDIKENFPEIYQLIFPSWGSGFSSQDLSNQMSFQVGTANLIAVILSFLTLFLIKDNQILTGNIKYQISKIKNDFKYQKQLIALFLIWFFIVFFLMLEFSLPIWEIVPFMNYFQFPWRLLSLEILICSFLAGSIFSFYKSKFVAFFLIAFAVFLSFGYTKSAYYHNRYDKYYLTRSNFIDGTNSVGNLFNTIWFNQNLKKQNNKLELEQQDKILSKEIKSQNYKFKLLTDKSKSIILNTSYFPGWTVFINGKQEKVSYTIDGRIFFNVPKGETKIEVIFLDTIVRKIATLISLASFFILILFSKRSLRLWETQ